ncbi:MAG TPA: hypothetical protein PLW32_05355 [Chitinophagaceae bacterium]|nr:hypothetical protein [Chitinophagaceae bacterium]
MMNWQSNYITTIVHQLNNQLSMLIFEEYLQPTCHYLYHSIIFDFFINYKIQHENITQLP